VHWVRNATSTFAFDRKLRSHAATPDHRRFFFLIIALKPAVALLAVFGGNLFNMCQQNAEHVRHVLPKNVTPKHYDLTLTPDLVNFTFAGEVEVKYALLIVLN
jgi:hypothetical protein